MREGASPRKWWRGAAKHTGGEGHFCRFGDRGEFHSHISFPMKWEARLSVESE